MTTFTDRISRIFHAALAGPPEGRSTFLAQECGADDALKQELESLLAMDAGAADFLERPAASALAGGPAGAPGLAGTRLGKYEIGALIGTGGMAEVYRARDGHLGRDVAIKMLPPRFADDPDRLARFEREARLLASLNHPRIATIHGLERIDTHVFLVLELVEGLTLADRLEAGPVAVADALILARQIAEALEAAHARGIVHRDLKPTNVKITADGSVKLLDFGVAKATVAASTDGEREQRAETSAAGLIVGTAAYMSPEQARGQAVDQRSDIWAFGCVLYEMLTGRQAYRGNTAPDVFAAVLTREPDWSALPASTPAPIRLLLRRCLEKIAARRVREIADARLEIEQALASAFVAGDEPKSTARARTARPAALAIWMLLPLVVLAGYGAWRAWPGRDSEQPSVGEYRRITRHQVLFPPHPSEIPILTDGPRIYFNEFVNGVIRAGQVSVSGGEPVQMRFGVAPYELVEAISPDGTELLVAGWDDATALSDVPYWVVPLVGGTPRRLGTVTGHGSHWLPDGRILYAYGDELFLVDRFGERRVKVAAVGGRPYWPRVSRDGTRIRFTRFSSRTAFRVEALWEVGTDGTGLRPLLPGWNEPPAECCGEWSRDGTFYVFQSTRQGQTQLWALRDDGDRPERPPIPVQLTRGPVQFRRPIFTRDGRSILANGWHARGELTRFDPASGGLAPYARGLSAEWLTHSRDGRWIAYVTYPEGELWRARLDGSQGLRLTAPGVRACCVRLSPDGTKAVFVSSRGEEAARTLVVSMDGAGLAQVDVGGEADWSADGTNLVIVTKAGLEMLTLDGGARQLIPDSVGLGSPAWSPDGRHIAATRIVGGQLRVYDVAKGRWRELPSLSVGFPNWSRDGRDLYFVTGRRAPAVIRNIARWRLGTNQVDVLMDVRSLRLAWGTRRHWLGLSPQDHPLFLRDLSTHDLYALEWRAQE
jgi:Tol biopolymer transport system component/tRNA A-37 threonylcarbamoyl transferase component Bud32